MGKQSKNLNKKVIREKVFESVEMTVKSYRAQAVKNGGKYTQAGIAGLINAFENRNKEIITDEVMVSIFVTEGCYCEGEQDYEAALRFYENSLNYETKEQDFAYFRLNNLGFCLNNANKYKEAQEYLEKAIKIMPERYNAWKNLGISLQFQKKIQSAA